VGGGVGGGGVVVAGAVAVGVVVVVCINPGQLVNHVKREQKSNFFISIHCF
jgi:hypothetical protein